MWEKVTASISKAISFRKADGCCYAITVCFMFNDIEIRIMKVTKIIIKNINILQKEKWNKNVFIIHY